MFQSCWVWDCEKTPVPEPTPSLTDSDIALIVISCLVAIIFIGLIALCIYKRRMQAPADRTPLVRYIRGPVEFCTIWRSSDAFNEDGENETLATSYSVGGIENDGLQDEALQDHLMEGEFINSVE